MDFIYQPNFWDNPTELIIIMAIAPPLLILCIWPTLKKTRMRRDAPLPVWLLISAMMGLLTGMVICMFGSLVFGTSKYGQAREQIITEVAAVYGQELGEESAELLLTPEGSGHQMDIEELAEGREPGTVERFGIAERLVDGEQVSIQLVWYDQEWIIAEASEARSPVVELAR